MMDLRTTCKPVGTKEKHVISEGRKTVRERLGGRGGGKVGGEGLPKGKFRIGNAKQRCFSQGALKKMLQL